MLMPTARPLADLENANEFVARHIGISETDERLMLSVIALVVVASMAGAEFRLVESFVLSLILAAGSYVIFIKLLSLPFQVWPSFIAG